MRAKYLPQIRRALSATALRQSDKFHIRTGSAFVSELQGEFYLFNWVNKSFTNELYYIIFLHNIFYQKYKNISVIDPLEIDILPVYQIMDRGGKIMNKSQDPNFSKEDALHMYKTMMSVSNLLTSL